MAGKKRLNNKADKCKPGTSFVIEFPFRFNVSAPDKFHNEVREYFDNIKKKRCPSCKRIINKFSFKDIIKNGIYDDVGITGIEDLKEFEPYGSLIKKWTREFWDNLPLKGDHEEVKPTNYSKAKWEQFKKNLESKNGFPPENSSK